jgi:signal transduction histidine kinase
VFRRLSLASKCLLVFSVATALVVLAAMVAPWIRMTRLIDEGQLEVSRQMVAIWERLAEEDASFAGPPAPSRIWNVPAPAGASTQRGGINARLLTLAEAKIDDDRFVRESAGWFIDNPEQFDRQQAAWVGTSREYRYAKAIWRARERGGGRELSGLIELKRRPISATAQLITNTAYLLLAGAAVLLAALVVFYVITRKLVLQPVDQLRLAAERARGGNLAFRSDIQTGDEFQELSETFNWMVTDLQATQDRLRAINAAMDVKLHELEASNSALHQAAKLKGEFLASVSHELRTPLNSINGFAELLLELARGELEHGEPSATLLKRIRYLENILTAGRGLLALINSLLEMARIEAGKVDLRIELVNVRESCEGLLGLISPLASKKHATTTLEVGDDVPIIRTDHRKLQQIIFNFLSNAVKFSQPLEKTGREPVIILRAERLPAGADGAERVRISVIDNGPGIPKDEQQLIFEKFYQAEGGHTREASGTGLGLAICKDLATLLRADIQLVSDVGRGSMFSLILPVVLEPVEAPPALAAS